MSVRQLSVPRPPALRPAYTTFVVALVAIWGVGDAASTLLAMWLGGSVGLESNPLVRSLLAEHLLLLPLFKGAVVALAGGLLLEYDEHVESVPGWRLWFGGVLALGALIVVTNAYVALTLL